MPPLPLPFPYLPGDQAVPEPEFQDRAQQNFDALANAAGSKPRADPAGTGATVAGAWSTSVPTSTQSVAFSVAAVGTYLFTCHASAYTAAAGSLIAITVYINGVSAGTISLFANEANSHKALVPAVFSVALPAGTNYIHYRQTGGTSNADDAGGFTCVRIA